MSYIDDRGEVTNFDLTTRWRLEELTDLAVKETTEFKDMSMTIIVKKPDYLGMSKWMLRHGKKSVEAKIDDIPWLRKFQSRQIDVRPGDVLKCRVTLQHRYGFDDELIDENYTIAKIEGVAENHSRQLILDE